MASTSKLWIQGCFIGCRDHTRTRLGTRIWNLTDRPIELQIRIGSVLKKGYTVAPGSVKRLKCKSIYKTYVPNRYNVDGGRMKNLLYDYDERYHPYVWINDNVGNSTKMVKQQYVSLDDLREFAEIKIFRDNQRGCICVIKKPRSEFC